MFFIQVKDGEGLPMLVDLQQYSQIFIDKKANQSPDDVSRFVWGRYDSGQDGNNLFEGTQVECILFMEKISEMLNATPVNKEELFK